MSYTNCKTPPLITFATNLKQHINSSLNHITPLDSTSINSPNSTLTPVTLTISHQSLLLYCWRRATVLVEIFSSISQLSTLCGSNDPNQPLCLPYHISYHIPFQAFLIMLHLFKTWTFSELIHSISFCAAEDGGNQFRKDCSLNKCKWNKHLINICITVYMRIFRAYFFRNLAKKNWGAHIIWNNVGTAPPPNKWSRHALRSEVRIMC